jgi:hypothetical protein
MVDRSPCCQPAWVQTKRKSETQHKFPVESNGQLERLVSGAIRIDDATLTQLAGILFVRHGTREPEHVTPVH